MNVLIVDDEDRARRLIKSFLEDYALENAQSINFYEASNVKQAVTSITENAIAIVLLDIRMPEESGLSLLKYFEGKHINFQIIFTTAHNEYAVEAFKSAAVDYLLKPIDPDELFSAMDKAKARIKSENIDHRFDQLQESFNKLSLDKIAIDVARGYKFVSHNDIICFEADGMYTKVFLKGKPVELISKPLKHFAEQLQDNSLFYRPQRSYLVNLKYLTEVKKNEGLYLILENGTSISVSRDKRQEFLSIIKNTF